MCDGHDGHEPLTAMQLALDEKALDGIAAKPFPDARERGYWEIVPGYSRYLPDSSGVSWGSKKVPARRES